MIYHNYSEATLTCLASSRKVLALYLRECVKAHYRKQPLHGRFGTINKIMLFSPALAYDQRITTSSSLQKIWSDDSISKKATTRADNPLHVASVDYSETITTCGWRVGFTGVGSISLGSYTSFVNWCSDHRIEAPPCKEGGLSA
ncbi:hypothetical protein C0J52_27782 [Blattella germanica]|nr:hypothetical protein C0J52_27782 [Blattella germanica]